jgi:hypothetical protein
MDFSAFNNGILRFAGRARWLDELKVVTRTVI